MKTLLIAALLGSFVSGWIIGRTHPKATEFPQDDWGIYYARCNDDALIAFGGLETAGVYAEMNRRSQDACRNHGKVLGVGGISSDEDCAFYIGMGSRFITSGSDHGYIVAGSIERAQFIRRLVASATSSR